MTRDPWRYRCRECGSVALSPLVAGGYRCDPCGRRMAEHERVDAKALA